MRMLALPAACILAFILYPLLPQAERRILEAIDSSFSRFARRFSDENQALPAFLLLLFAMSSLFAALHPAVAALLMAPLFSAPAILPGCVQMKDDLDSGKYVRDIPAYEANVRKTCAALAPAFLAGAVSPMLLCAAGMPLYIGCGLGWVYFALRELHPYSAAAQRIMVVLLRLSDRVFSFFMLLCAGVVGRNPLRTKGHDAKSHLMSILGIAQDGADTHAPMAGDIPQGIFLCCFCCALLLLSLTAIGLALC